VRSKLSAEREISWALYFRSAKSTANFFRETVSNAICFLLIGFRNPVVSIAAGMPRRFSTLLSSSNGFAPGKHALPFTHDGIRLGLAVTA
jgi:hypothetical protein